MITLLGINISLDRLIFLGSFFSAAGLLRIARRSSKHPSACRYSSLLDEAVVCGLLVARLGYVIGHADAYRTHPYEALFFWLPGYAPLYGLAGGLTWALVRLWRNRAAYTPDPGVFVAAALPLVIALLYLGVRAQGDTTRHDAQIADALDNLPMISTGGQPVSLKNLKGHSIVVNLWASWRNAHLAGCLSAISEIWPHGCRPRSLRNTGAGIGLLERARRNVHDRHASRFIGNDPDTDRATNHYLRFSLMPLARSEQYWLAYFRPEPSMTGCADMPRNNLTGCSDTAIDARSIARRKLLDWRNSGLQGTPGLQRTRLGGEGNGMDKCNRRVPPGRCEKLILEGSPGWGLSPTPPGDVMKNNTTQTFRSAPGESV